MPCVRAATPADARREKRGHLPRQGVRRASCPQKVGGCWALRATRLLGQNARNTKPPSTCRFPTGTRLSRVQQPQLPKVLAPGRIGSAKSGHLSYRTVNQLRCGSIGRAIAITLSHCVKRHPLRGTRKHSTSDYSHHSKSTNDHENMLVPGSPR